MQAAPFITFSLSFIAQITFAQENVYPAHRTSEHPPVGLYRDAPDFLSFRPADTMIVFQHIPELSGEGINDFFRRKDGNKKGARIRPAEYFAASDGTNFYISYDGKWHKAKKCDSGYCFLSVRSGADYTHPKGVHFSLQDRSNGVVQSTDFTELAARNRKYRFEYSLRERKWVPMERLNEGW